MYNIFTVQVPYDMGELCVLEVVDMIFPYHKLSFVQNFKTEDTNSLYPYRNQGHNYVLKKRVFRFSKKKTHSFGAPAPLPPSLLPSD